MTYLTEAQASALKRLEDAVQACLEAYSDPEDRYMLSNFIVCTSVQTIADNDIVLTSYPMFLRGGDLPWCDILGLLETHKVFANKAIVSGNNNG